MNKLPISAFIVSKNEGHLLEDCIKSILFCDEIIVVNLESTDDTVAIAEKYKARVITIAPIPVIEMIHEKYISITKNKWVLITDPDEVASPELVKDIQDYFLSLEATSAIGAVDVPLIYYFKSHMLKGTSWGNVKSRTYLIHKDRFTFNGNVHNGRFLNEGFKNHRINHTGKNHINHYWMQGYRQILEKHLRYLKNEGKSRYDSGYRTTLSQIIKIPHKQFLNSFVYARGFKDGFVGLFLSFFRAWYFTAANYELYKYQKKQLKNK